MKLLLFAEYVRRAPVSVSRWAVDIARAMRDRGHEVVAACDGIEDRALFEGFDLRVFRPERRHLSANPFPFIRWAAALRESVAHDRSLSLTPLIAADFRLPVGSSAAETMRGLFRAKTPLGAALEFVHSPFLPGAAFAESMNEGGRRLAFGLTHHDPRTTPIGFASRFDSPDPDLVGLLRMRTREMLGIDPDRVVLLASVVHPERTGLRAFLRGFGAMLRERPGRSPLALIAGRSGESIARAAAEAGCLASVRILGRTDRMDALLAACDLAAAPLAAAHYGSRGVSLVTTATGRFVADALRLGRPVIALNRAAGAELLKAAETGPDPIGPGWIVENSDVTPWSMGLTTTLSEAWRTHRLPAAERAGALLSMDALAQRLEGVLAEAGAPQAAPALG